MSTPNEDPGPKREHDAERPPMPTRGETEEAQRQEVPAHRTQRYETGSFCPDPPEVISPDERDHDWAISGSILSILWSDMYPKLAALAMKTGGSGIGWPTVGDPVDCRNWLVTYLPKVEPPTPRPYSELIRRRQLLLKYLDREHAIPITFRGWGSYDFILSDRGIDLFAPPPLHMDDSGCDPGIGYDPARQLFQFYQIRSTGEAPIGMPLFLDSKVRNIVMDAPDGPAQVYLPSAAIEELLNCGCKERDDEGPERDSVPYETVVQYLGRRRIWWLEGSVVRGILGQLPRIVATIWYEDSLKVTPAGGYRYRYTTTTTPAGEDNLKGTDCGIRSIFAERMETALPSDNHMDFDTHPDPLPFPGDPLNEDPVEHRKGSANPQKGDPHQTPFWDVEDVMITARGIYVPELPKKAPSANDVMKAVAQGRAGNPVFTSTWLCNAI